MSNLSTFIDRALAGEVLDPGVEIDDAIDAWHDAETTLTLPQWLGMTSQEYQLYAEQPYALRSILAARHMKKDVSEILASQADSTSLAARGANPSEIASLREWLKRTGRL
jgi:hypothetical protein